MSERFVDNYLLFQLAAISHSFSEEFHKYLRSQGMNHARWRVLASLVDSDGVSLGTLVKSTLFEQSRVTKIVDQLCAEGLTERKSGKTDRRRVTVQLTPEGNAVVLPLIEAAKAHEEKVLSTLPEDDQKHLKSILSVFVQNHFKSTSP